MNKTPMPTTTTDKATARPWRTTAQSVAIISTYQGDRICAINHGLENAEANAALIVRSVNSFDESQAVIRALLSVLPYGNEALQIRAEKLLRGDDSTLRKGSQ